MDCANVESPAIRTASEKLSRDIAKRMNGRLTDMLPSIPGSETRNLDATTARTVRYSTQNWCPEPHIITLRPSTANPAASMAPMNVFADLLLICVISISSCVCRLAFDVTRIPEDRWLDRPDSHHHRPG